VAALDLGKYTRLQQLNGPEWAQLQALTALADKSAGGGLDEANLLQFQHDLVTNWNTKNNEPGQGVGGAVAAEVKTEVQP
jgi:hypothetical protein